MKRIVNESSVQFEFSAPQMCEVVYINGELYGTADQYHEAIESGDLQVIDDSEAIIGNESILGKW